MHITGYGLPAGIGVLLIAGAATLRYHHHRVPRTPGRMGDWLRKASLSHRVSMLAFLAGAAFLALGVLPLQDALATLTGTGAGLIAVLIVAFFTALGFWFEMRHHHEHKRARAHVYGAVTGVLLVMLVLNGARLLREAATSPRSTARALAQSVTRVSSGHAAHSMTGRRALEVVGIAAAALVAVLMFAGKRTAKGGKGGKGAGSASSGPRAIDSGRPAIPSGKGH